MSRLNQRLVGLRKEKRTALVAYLVAGDPDVATTPELMHALVRGGADVIELGVPFTDPIADGPVIQAACERALRNGIRLAQVFDIVRRFREQDTKTPVVLMGYLNPLEAIGYENYARQSRNAGADAVLLVDLPPEEAAQLQPVLAAYDLELVALVSPTTHADRLERICQSVTGFVYYVSIKGVTGAGGIDHAAMRERIAQLRRLTDRPIGVGFGISDGATAAIIGQHADAVIIGSAIVKRIAESGAGKGADHGTDTGKRLTEFLAMIREALDNDAAA